MTSITKRTQRDYTLAFKLAVAAQVESGNMTSKQAQAHYGIQGRSTVLTWLRKHGQLDWSQVSILIGFEGSAMTDTTNTLTPVPS